MRSPSIDQALAVRAVQPRSADRWGVTPEVFAQALARSAASAAGDRELGSREIARLLESLHLEDLALAVACTEGHEAAWEHFVREFRPVLYRSGGCDRSERQCARAGGLALCRSLRPRRTRRSTSIAVRLTTTAAAVSRRGLRAVLAQRHVDRIRVQRRIDPLPEEDDDQRAASPAPPPDPDRPRLLSRSSAVRSRWCCRGSAPAIGLRLRPVLRAAVDAGRDRTRDRTSTRRRSRVT